MTNIGEHDVSVKHISYYQKMKNIKYQGMNTTTTTLVCTGENLTGQKVLRIGFQSKPLFTSFLFTTPSPLPLSFLIYAASAVVEFELPLHVTGV